MAYQINDSTVSQTVSAFRLGNAQLGNRDIMMQTLRPDIAEIDGRMIKCPGCFDKSGIHEKNDETHMVIDCGEINQYRKLMMVTSNQSLEQYIKQKKDEGFTSSTEILKQFLGEDKTRERSDFYRRGRILEDLRDIYISSWKEKSA